MKRRNIVLGVILILSAALLIEYYTNRRFPVEELDLTGVPSLEIGKSHTFTYDYEFEPVGTYAYTITEKKGDLYTMLSNTEVSFEGTQISLESNFVFNEQYVPQSYLLTIDQGGETNTIGITFMDGNVTSKISINNDTTTISQDFPDGSFLTENNMPGLWEILLISSRLERGSRYSAKIYIPQGGDLFDLEFFVSNDLQNLNINGKSLNCIVVNESKLSLRFYLFENELVQMRNDDQDVIFTRIN